MKRRTYRKLRAAQQRDHHNVYVVLLDPAVCNLRKVRAANPKHDPKKPCVYVGMTGLALEERFANHKAGIKAAAVVKMYGIRLLPELYEHLNPMPFEAAAQMELDFTGGFAPGWVHGHGRALTAPDDSGIGRVFYRPLRWVI